ncbi:hypothetical protein BaOVIS_008730 [Babesia ovis]|uniref:Uncharacterized protein n=1 Tax=Babesia ovis TaxID=5869 RepID=A0A9W5TD30_BABOV|nr:hypothetical protein BaOVIS_008730 [Babesia ovis]
MRMGNKIWKEYVRKQLQELEASSEEVQTKPIPRDTEEDSALIESEPLTWCRSVERCIAYTFESYCKLVITTALMRAQAGNTTVLTVSNIKETIDKIFRPVKDATNTSKTDRKHNIDRCVHRYRYYLKWYRQLGHLIYRRKLRYKGNLSCTRSFDRTLVRFVKHKRTGVVTFIATEKQLEKYAHIPPQHKSHHVSLNQVFGD